MPPGDEAGVVPVSAWREMTPDHICDAVRYGMGVSVLKRLNVQEARDKLNRAQMRLLESLYVPPSKVWRGL